MKDPSHELSTLMDKWEYDVEVFKEWVCAALEGFAKNQGYIRR